MPTEFLEKLYNLYECFINITVIHFKEKKDLLDRKLVKYFQFIKNSAKKFF